MSHPINKTELAERFWSRVDKTPDCWIWRPSGIKRNGKPCYGLLRVGPGYGNGQAAHRISWQLCIGPIPEGLFVLHHCDNPPCVNPDHLFLGTRKDNAQDMISKCGPRWWERGKRVRKQAA